MRYSGIKIDNENIKTLNKIAMECLNPENLIERLSAYMLAITHHHSGHIHFYLRGKSDHIIFIWLQGKLRRIEAKSPDCEKHECIEWEDSQFCDYKPKNVLRKLHNEIECMEINGHTFKKRWPSYIKFIEWLA